MTSALKKAWDEVTKLPPDQQDTMAAIILEELASERKWDELLSSKESQDLLARMADEAIDEHRQGRTRPLDEVLSTVESKRQAGQPRTRSGATRSKRKQGR